MVNSHHKTRWKEPGGPHPAWAACLPLGCHETDEEASALLGPLCLRTYGLQQLYLHTVTRVFAPCCKVFGDGDATSLKADIATQPSDYLLFKNSFLGV